MATVYAVGTVNADFTLEVDGRLEPGADVLADRLLRTSGGRGGNVAVAARRLGADVRLFGCVGDDDLAEQALDGPRAAGVDVGGVRRADAPTGVTTVIAAGEGGSTMVYAPGANARFTDWDASALDGASAGAVLVADAELGEAVVADALSSAGARRLVTVLDPTGPPVASARLLGLAAHVTPNAVEAERLTGVAVTNPDDARRAAEELRGLGAEHVYVKLPEGGCVATGPGGDLIVAAPDDVEFVDATGAGDAFAAALAVALAGGRTAREAAVEAVAAAACAVTRLGAQPSLPDRAELDAMARRVGPA